jgi:hypothetical protein
MSKGYRVMRCTEKKNYDLDDSLKWVFLTGHKQVAGNVEVAYSGFLPQSLRSISFALTHHWIALESDQY